MLSQLLGGLKNELVPTLTKDANVEENKLDDIVSVIGDVAKKEVGKEMAGNSLSGLTSLISGSSSASSSSSSLKDNLTSGIVSGLMSKVGITNSTAQMIAGKAIPVVMSFFSKSDDNSDDDKSDDGGSMLGDLAGKFF